MRVGFRQPVAAEGAEDVAGGLAIELAFGGVGCQGA
jgi:hypothetical protein